MVATAEDAATTIDTMLRGYPWYRCCGVGRCEDYEAVHIYIASPRHRPLVEEYLRDFMLKETGFHVVIHNVGKVVPAELTS